MKIVKKISMLLILVITLVTFASCSAKDFFGDYSQYQDSTSSGEDEYLKGTNNCIFVYPINYYAQEGQNFTAKWHGMKKALEQHGVTITGDDSKDSKQFKYTISDDTDLPSDFQLVFVNNQTWDTSLALSKPLKKYTPMAIVSTCNGVEFCSAQIMANSPNTRNCTLGGFSDAYQKAFENGSLAYLGVKFAASVGPIVAATYSAVQGAPIRTPNGEAIRIGQKYWMINSLEEYLELAELDQINDNPVYKKCDYDKIIPATNPNATYEDFYNWASASGVEEVKAKYQANRDIVDTPVATEKFKIGLIVPGSINDAVQAYVDYISKYMAVMYNFEVVMYPVSSSVNQKAAAQQACDANCKAIISLQDDTDRNAAIEYANSRGVYSAIVGNSQNDKNYNEVKDLPYFVGSIGSGLQDEIDAEYEMVEYYLQKMIQRGEWTISNK
jgi:hypothetical protein